MDEQFHHQWRARLRKRRGKTFNTVAMRELNLVAMMDMLTIILVFLLKSYSGSSLSMDAGGGVRFPQSSETIVPEEAIKLTVTQFGKEEDGFISVGDRNVLKLDASTTKKLSNQSKARQFLIQEVFAALQEEIVRVRTKQPPSTAGAATPTPKAQPKITIPYEGKILVIADKETPYWLITEVLYTSAQAGFDKYNLVAIQENQ